MTKVVFILLYLSIFCTNIQAEDNPKPYCKIGDIIYSNQNHINNLQYFSRYKIFNTKIKSYVNEVEKTKQIGYKLGDNKKDALSYLKRLRVLLKTNDFFLRTIENDFNEAIKKDDVALFTTTLQTHLVDTQTQKAKILSFFKKHKDEVPVLDSVTKLLEEEARIRQRNSIVKTKKQIEQERLERIRKDDLKKQKEFEKHLSQELDRKKEKIRKEQEKELFN